MFNSKLNLSYDISPSRMITTNFMEEIQARRLVCTMYASWTTDSKLLDGLENPINAYSNESGKSQIAFIEGADALAHVESSFGSIYANIAGRSLDACKELLENCQKRLPKAENKDPDQVPISFWSYGAQGPQVMRRNIAIRPWSGIEHNYTRAAYEGLDHLMDPEFRPGHGGQLILWSGEAGTGKTTALRALSAQWREWCSFNYITDPETFFGHRADYMLKVLLEDSHKNTDKWRVLILEDTGELLRNDAKAISGQAFARLLNVVDGMIGQGLNVLVLVTTNEPIGKLNPAIIRPGRCASRVEFTPLTIHESEEWLIKEGADTSAIEGPMALADLYAALEGFKEADVEEKKPVGFGF